MGNSASDRRGWFWRADWFVALLTVLAVILLHLGTDFIGTLERRFYDFASTSSVRQPSERIAVIAIDDQSIANIGRWPWPRDVHARLIDQLAAARAETIVHTAFFFEPQTDRGLGYIRQMKEALGPDPGTPPSAVHEQLSRLMLEAEVALDTDAKLAASMKRAGNVLVPSFFTLGEPQGRADKPLPSYALRSALDETGGFSVPATQEQQPIEAIGSAAAGIAHLNRVPDLDGAVRREPLLVNYHGKAVPSMALLAAARSLNLDPGDIRLNPGESVQIGKLRVRTDESALMLPQFYKGRDGKPAFVVDAFYDVLNGKIPATKYSDKIVLIGATAAGVGAQFPTPGYPSLSAAETNRMMGLALQGQGQLDMAFDRFRRVPMSDAVMDNLNNLALDFERKRQFNKAQAVYEQMAGWNRNYRDLPGRLKRARQLSETVMLGAAGAHPGGTLLLDGGAVEKPMLGRYQVEKELGKGAMGVVYLGKDPKIGRVVAIKTLALSQEFEGEELDDARGRFFREAETAGRLQHQNIVTIFDAGEEHDLAYIAMEFLKGRDLTDVCRADRLLPVPQVLSIVARVAEALAYAHRQHVVHRDIKPANIMYDPGGDTVKVTDFGIARIADASRTRTGFVLGTPSYMSPEQIAGRRVDGRSDLYSLGVMLFQLLTGALPLRGDSMAELMYKIASEEAPDIRSIRSELPEALARIVALSLSKHPETRYQDGDAFAAELRSVTGDAKAGTAAAALATAGAASFDDTAVAATRSASEATALATTVVDSAPRPGLARAGSGSAGLQR